MHSGISFSVLHGDGEARLDSAWRLIQALLGLPPELAVSATERRWSWTCDKCSDPVCEHRLFRDLLENKKRDQGTEPPP